MTPSDLNDRFFERPAAEKLVLAILALVGSVPGQSWLVGYLNKGRFRTETGISFTKASIELVLLNLKQVGLVDELAGYGYSCARAVQVSALKSAMAGGTFTKICDAVDEVDRVNFATGRAYPTNAHNTRVMLRMALLRQRDTAEVHRCLALYFEAHFREPLHPYIAWFARPFEPAFFELLHPRAQKEMMPLLLRDAAEQLAPVAPLEQAMQRLLPNPEAHAPSFISIYAEHGLLCGRIDQAFELLGARQETGPQFVRSAAWLLKGDLPAAIAGFEAGLKELRASSGKRSAIFSGFSGHLHVLALLRSGDDKLIRRAQSYIDQGLTNFAGAEMLPYSRFNYLHGVNLGTHKVNDRAQLFEPTDPLGQLWAALIDYWVGVALTPLQALKLVELGHKSEAAGFLWMAAVCAELLESSSSKKMQQELSAFLERAAQLRKKLGLLSVLDWFERQEPWQRQLAALAKLGPTADTANGAESGAAQTRLIWELMPHKDSVSLAPREQKRKGKAGWTGGRAVALSRLHEDAATMDFLTAQDRAVCALIRHENQGYYGSSFYLIDGNRALPHLIGHRLVFWAEPTGVRVEILRGEMELEIKKADADTLTLCLQPPLGNQSVVVIKETPTRLRVIEVTDALRQIAGILGDSLRVPVRAKEQVLDAIRSISSLITVQSDLDVLPANMPTMQADSRLHVHLMPHGEGLRVTLLVRPFASEGPYYAPGAGSDSVIAEVAGMPTQARRDLASEVAAASALVAACPVLRDAQEQHSERVVDDPQDCLELLLQLQAHADRVLLAWPEGEKFKLSRELGSAQFSMSIKRDVDWFAVTGALTVDEQQVIDLSKLLELTAAARGRFIHLGGNQFLALTDAFRQRLNELQAYAARGDKGLRVHRLAAGALQELADEAGKLKADKFWKEHLVRLSELDNLQPALPSTLAAELRDYQLSGFLWLSRLAHWGVGACLADDMGLGKTIQALALLLARAPQGPTLVVAPTSVCLNWQSEIARFAPTLKVTVFGTGNRQKTLSDLQPFDLVITTYGLLQQEAERFAAVQWHSIVLDEAQAIKNQLTKRSQAAMALQGDFRMILSGTPVENHLGELWNLFRFINPGLLGSLEHFNERYAGPIERLQDAGARNRLRKLIAPFMLRRTKSQVLSELPSRTEILRQVELSAEEAALYEALRREALERLASTVAEGGQQYIQILAEIMKLRRACCNPQLVAPALGLPSSKLAAFGELLDELLANHHKALVFSQFVDHLSLIRQELDKRGVRYQYLDGSTPMAERQVRVNAFQAGEGDVFLISLKAGGTGLNLTAADYVIHMDPWWNPAVEDQASDRAHRIGQTRPVTIYRLVAKGTIEEKIVDLHKTKRALADSLLEGADMAAKMSADDMLELLQDEWAAQAD
ncbi:MAG: DEAD/DEAH box helicase [Gammaproteobacteria bacterium]|uniref:DEAD/DEAH box helicase n=1 Tax=Rhodoferax sp. TaxID=50421 RepID=UPI001848415F|nr:DEAD/DEAH box helicase [Rhodoferax sp.]MBU3900374.1 DEAD/DEAH box helicase [Gammaproteobacteria bacterium]MBA3058439.1 DEAD/DEAH box helicase [Rhodoferax sp.]MBU3999313.1 DEAD/DEAH box helicase [Gammaproteobacteria bacterium]MBU4018960.1 DEAD/DEAH box helicase [Gammaproteobacteria bacterium]MBU4080951.1 DEAD/DEAH box helicase [Gammaproteobacteria bacterium]